MRPPTPERTGDQGEQQRDRQPEVPFGGGLGEEHRGEGHGRADTDVDLPGDDHQSDAEGGDADGRGVPQDAELVVGAEESACDDAEHDVQHHDGGEQTEFVEVAQPAEADSACR